MAVDEGDKDSCAGAIGTIAIESAHQFLPVREAFWMSEAWRKANLRYWPFYGRGLVQTTWQYNYQALDDAFGWGCVANPDLLLDPGKAATAFAFYWAGHHIQDEADRLDWPAVRTSVQGGLSGEPELAQISTDLLAA